VPHQQQRRLPPRGPRAVVGAVLVAPAVAVVLPFPALFLVFPFPPRAPAPAPGAAEPSYLRPHRHARHGGREVHPLGAFARVALGGLLVLVVGFAVVEQLTQHLHMVVMMVVVVCVCV